MGGSNSTRNLTIEQDEAVSGGTGVVQVSEAVAERLFRDQQRGKPVERVPVKEHSSTPTDDLARQIEAEELERLKDFYEKRINTLEGKNEELYQTTTEQFAKAVEEVERKFLKSTQPPICQSLEEQVLKCYQENPRQTLHCSAQVKAFAACVQTQRENILEQKG